jgi:hypothetical protein
LAVAITVAPVAVAEGPAVAITGRSATPIAEGAVSALAVAVSGGSATPLVLAITGRPATALAVTITI